MQAPTERSTSPRSLDLGELPWVRRFAADYAHQFDAVASFFAGNPASPPAWSAAIARAQSHPRPRADVAARLEAQLVARDAPPAARAAAAKLSDEQTIAIVTGQQAGLFGGPLFTLLKALTALRLAERVEREHGVPAVAIFWIDSEDHDWDEVASATVLDADFEPRTIGLPAPEGAGEVPVARVRLGPEIAAAVDALKTTLAPTEFTDELVASLGAAYRPGAGMSEAFACWLDRVLGSRGLVLFDCADLAVKPLVADLFSREVEHAGRTSELALAAGHELERLGYHAQVTPHHDGLALFHLDTTRHPLRREGEVFQAGERRFDRATLAELVRRHPEQFSPNVLLRPLVQDTLFPTVAYVAGPSELVYLGQLRGVYEHFGVPMPLVHPRITATLLDSAASRFLARYDVALAALQPQNESELNRLLEAQLPPSVEAALEEAKQAIEARMAAVVTAVPAIDPTLEGAAKSTLGRMEHDLRTLHGKIIQAAKRRDETLRRQFTRTRAQAFPHGHLQERELGFVYFLNRYGPSLVDVLAAELPLDLGRHWVLTL